MQEAVSLDQTPKESNLEEQPSEATPVSPVSPTIVSPSLPDFTQGDARLFLDICSGATRPLSSAILAKHGNVLSFDILLDKHMDLLNDQSYEQLLRICSSGQVAYGAASPSCAHYSRAEVTSSQAPKHLGHLKLWTACQASTAWNFYRFKSLI